MFFDVAATITSLFSTLALFVFKSNNNIGREYCTTSSSSTSSSLLLKKKITVPYSLFSTSNLNNDRDFVGKSIEKEKYSDLLVWLKEQDDATVINECLQIKESSQGQGYGVFVNKSMKKDELLFSIPRSLCVTIDKATSSTYNINDDDFGNTLKLLIEKAGQGGVTVSLAGYIAKEYIMLCSDKDKDYQTTSRWGPYFKTLPTWESGINNQEHILFWSGEKIEELLRGSLCYAEARSLRNEVALSIQVLGPLLKKSIRESRGQETATTINTKLYKKITTMFQFNKQPTPDDIIDDKIVSNAVKGAFVTLLTRSFQDYNDNEKLVPLLDLLQHSETPNVRHNVVTVTTDHNANNNDDAVDTVVEVRARHNIDAGSEIFNQYQSEEANNMPYARFFTRFGFVPGISEPMENLLLDKSPIFFDP